MSDMDKRKHAALLSYLIDHPSCIKSMDSNGKTKIVLRKQDLDELEEEELLIKHLEDAGVSYDDQISYYSKELKEGLANNSLRQTKRNATELHDAVKILENSGATLKQQAEFILNYSVSKGKCS